ncbi:MAG: YicC/YloC family endoribonuclease [Pseudomonadota bacterium]
MRPEEAAPRDLQSMTGYGAAEGAAGSVTWRWELRSVNAKGLDVKFRIPTGTEVLEPDLRTELRVLHRGTVSANLKLDREESVHAFCVDDDALDAAVAAIDKVRSKMTCADPRPEAVLGMRGVLSAPVPETVLTDEELASLHAGFATALDALLLARRQEASRMAAVLDERCEDMTQRIAAIRGKTAGARELIAERLRSQLGELLAEQVSEDRLAQEAALLAIKADVTEELDRLDVHTTSFRELLVKGGAAGRRLEFLSQELMREASTLTAKLPSASMKSDGLDLKELVDSLREQVLNIA